MVSVTPKLVRYASVTRSEKATRKRVVKNFVWLGRC